MGLMNQDTVLSVQDFESILESAIEEENKGNFENAMNHYSLALEKSNGKSGAVLFRYAIFLFNQKSHKDALKNFISCYNLNYNRSEIEELVMNAYYTPNLNIYKANYENNVSNLKKYAYIYKVDFPSFDDLSYRFLPYLDKELVIFDNNSKHFISDFYIGSDDNTASLNKYKPKDILLIKNAYNFEQIIAYENKTADPLPVAWEKDPLYLFYEDFKTFSQFLQIFDLTNILEKNRIVFLFGMEDVNKWFSEPQAVIPSSFIGLESNNEALILTIINHNSRIDEESNQILQRINDYYYNFDVHNVIEKIHKGNPRILFFSSRFTTMVQFVIRNCMETCDSLGIPNSQLIEYSDVHRISRYSCIKALDEFRPDIVFSIDYFRYTWDFLPLNIPFITWIQDDMKHIMTEESAKKVSDRDFIINFYVDEKKSFADLGYKFEDFIEGIFPVNTNMYRNYTLTDDEKSDYGADICNVTHSGNPYTKIFNELLLPYKVFSNFSQIEAFFSKVFDEVREIHLNNGELYSAKNYEDLIRRNINMTGISLDEENIFTLAYYVRAGIGVSMARSTPLEWLHSRGYNMKLWGHGWLDHPILKKYAKGSIQSAEILSKIYRASKINLGVYPGTSAHPRAFESKLSNCLYMVKSAPPEYERANLRRFLIEDQEFVYFHDKDDLFRKVDYYLENEEKRKEIAICGIKKVLEEHSYSGFMKRILREVACQMEQRLLNQKIQN